MVRFEPGFASLISAHDATLTRVQRGCGLSKIPSLALLIKPRDSETGSRWRHGSDGKVCNPFRFLGEGRVSGEVTEMPLGGVEMWMVIVQVESDGRGSLVMWCPHVSGNLRHAVTNELWEFAVTELPLCINKVLVRSWLNVNIVFMKFVGICGLYFKGIFCKYNSRLKYNFLSKKNRVYF